MSGEAKSAYFDAYSPIQAHKHALLEHYLGAWYPKLTSWAGRVLYLETHAGRGIHKTGHKGSPLIAIETLLNHPQKELILRRSEIHFYLMENYPENAQVLRAQIAQQPKRPEIHVHVEECDFSVRFREELDRMEATGQRLVPAFVFMDPFGYSIPMDLVRRVLAFRNCEVMVNLMAQPVTRAVRDPSKAQNLNLLFGSDDWRSVVGITSFEDQMLRVVDVYSKAVGARWTTKLRLTGQTDYVLLHFTNHDEGRNTMKRAVWAITSKFGKAGINQLLVRDDPNQGTLIVPEPDLGPLERVLRSDFFGKDIRYSQLLKWLLPLDYTSTQLHYILAKGRKEGWLLTEYKKQFGPGIGDIPMRVVEGSLL